MLFGRTPDIASPRKGAAELPSWQHEWKDAREASGGRGRSVSSDHSIEALARKGRNGGTRRSGNGQAKGRIFQCKESVGNDSMGVKRQRIDEDQFFLSLEGQAASGHGAGGEGGTQASAGAALPAPPDVLIESGGSLRCWARSPRCERSRLALGPTPWTRVGPFFLTASINSVLLDGSSRVRYRAGFVARLENGC